MQNLLNKLIPLYIISLSSLTLFNLPFVGDKIQLPELFFISSLTAYMFVPKTLKIWKKQTIITLDWAVALYFIMFTLSCIMTDAQSVYLEWLGFLYLIVLYLLFNTFLLKFSPEQLSIWVLRVFVVLGMMTAFSGIVDWVFSPKTAQLYFGQVARASGWARSPTMLINILSICFLLKWAAVVQQKKQGLLDWLILTFFVLGMLTTLSKSIVLVGIGSLIVLGFKNELLQLPKYVVRLSCGFLCLVYITGTHVVFSTKNDSEWLRINKEAIIPTPVHTTENWFLYGSNYLANKKSAIRAGLENLPFGVGAGQHNNYVEQLKKTGAYPKDFVHTDPHSTYTGTFGEVGLMGFLALMGLFFIIGKTLKQQLSEQPSSLVIGLTACFVVAAIEATSTDIMNFRHYWVLLAILAVLARRHIIPSNKVLKSSLSKHDPFH